MKKYAKGKRKKFNKKKQKTNYFKFKNYTVKANQKIHDNGKFIVKTTVPITRTR